MHGSDDATGEKHDKQTNKNCFYEHHNVVP